jgi:threonine/homoserine/homoserine lactone efflux protein
MKTVTNEYSNLFYSALAAIAMIGPILLVIAAGTLPEGQERGDLIVYGHGVVLAVLATALILRAAYISGFKSALKNSDADSISFEETYGGQSMQS